MFLEEHFRNLNSNKAQVIETFAGKYYLLWRQRTTSFQHPLFHTDDDHFVGQFSGRGTGAAGGDEGGDGVQADAGNAQNMPAVALLRRMLGEPQGRGSAGHE